MFLSSRNKTRRFTTRFIHHGHRTVHYGRRGGLTVFSLSGHPYGNECYMPRASNSRARCNGTTVTSLSHFINCNIWRCGMTHWQSRQRYYVVIMLIFYRNFEIPIRLLMSRGEAGNPRGVINSEDRGLAKTSILAALTFTLVAENDNFIISCPLPSLKHNVTVTFVAGLEDTLRAAGTMLRQFIKPRRFEIKFRIHFWRFPTAIMVNAQYDIRRSSLSSPSQSSIPPTSANDNGRPTPDPKSFQQKETQCPNSDAESVQK